MKASENWFLAVVPSLLIGGCCTLSEYDDDCESSRGNRVVLTAGAAQLQAKPECIVVEPGDSITFERRAAEGVGTIRTVGKVGPQNADWLNSTGDRDEEPPTAPEFEPNLAGCDENVCEYGYEVIVEGVGRLDPRVRVRY